MGKRKLSQREMRKRQNIIFRLRRFGSIIPSLINNISKNFMWALPSAVCFRASLVQWPCW